MDNEIEGDYINDKKSGKWITWYPWDGDRMKLMVVITSLHSFYGLTTKKGQAKDFIGMMLEIKLGYGIGKVYLIVLSF